MGGGALPSADRQEKLVQDFIAAAIAHGRRGGIGKSMQLSNIAFQITDWSEVEPTAHPGERGTAYWRTRHFGDVRVRMVEYTADYLADHWCEKGHILLCLQGELHTQLRDGRSVVLTAGMSYQVADGAEPHRSTTPTGATLFIVD